MKDITVIIDFANLQRRQNTIITKGGGLLLKT